jgi:PTS system glucose-specific IIA component
MKQKEEEIIAPLLGEVVAIEEVPDPAFSEKMIGVGLAMIPSEGKVVSPVNGTVLQVFPTKHAVCLRSDQGLELLIHIGLETVSMGGEGFTVHIQAGDKVKVGDPLVDFSMDLVAQKAKSTITPIIITNVDKVAELSIEDAKDVKIAESVIMRVKLK